MHVLLLLKNETHGDALRAYVYLRFINILISLRVNKERQLLKNVGL